MCMREECDVVVLSNNDVLFDYTVNHAVDEARSCPESDLHYFGPTSNEQQWMGPNSAQRAKCARDAPSVQLAGDANLNGLFMVFPAHTLRSNMLQLPLSPVSRDDYPLASQRVYPPGPHRSSYYFHPQLTFAGNEREWSRRLTAMGGKGIVVPRTFVYHYKFRSWRSDEYRRETVCTLTTSIGAGIPEPMLPPGRSSVSRFFLTDSYSLAHGSPTQACLNEGALPIWVDTNRVQSGAALARDIIAHGSNYVPAWYETTTVRQERMDSKIARMGEENKTKQAERDRVARTQAERTHAERWQAARERAERERAEKKQEEKTRLMRTRMEIARAEEEIVRRKRAERRRWGQMGIIQNPHNGTAMPRRSLRGATSNPERNTRNRG
jgi:hypothetical protein